MSAEAWIAGASAVIATVAVFYGRQQSKHAAVQSKAADKQTDFSAKQLQLAEQVHRDAVQPYIFVDVGMSLADAQVMVVSVSNKGLTAAHDVKVRTEPSLVNPHDQQNVSVWSLPTLGPGAHFERVINTGAQFYGNHDYPKAVRVFVSGRGPWGELEPLEYDIDLEATGQMFAAKNLRVTVEDGLAKLDKSLKALIAVVGHLAPPKE